MLHFFEWYAWQCIQIHDHPIGYVGISIRVVQCLKRWSNNTSVNLQGQVWCCTTSNKIQTRSKFPNWVAPYADEWTLLRFIKVAGIPSRQRFKCSLPCIKGGYLGDTQIIISISIIMVDVHINLLKKFFLLLFIIMLCFRFWMTHCYIWRNINCLMSLNLL